MSTEDANKTELATIDPSPVRIGDARSMLMNLPVDQMIAIQDEYDARRQQFRDWLRSKLVEGLHYGYSPGCEPKFDNDGNMLVWSKGGMKPIPKSQWVAKPSLYKSGAEFVVDLMNLVAVYTADNTAWQMLGAAEGTFVIRCQLYPKGSQHLPENLVGEGLGCRQVGQKGGDANNALKMASKSAMVCAVLNSYGLSDLFTQDTEDGIGGPEPLKNPAPRNEPRVAPRSKRSQPVDNIGTVNERLQSLKARFKEVLTTRGESVTEDRWRNWVSESTAISSADALSLSAWNPAELKSAEDAMLELEGLPY